MKRKVLFLVMMLIVVSLCFGFTACKDNESNNVEKTATAPENVCYDGQYITWDKNGADYYNVSINGGSKIRVNSSTYAYATNDSFEATVYAVLGDTEEETTISFKPLDTIKEMYVSDDGIVSWDAVSGATAYSVSVNGNIVGQTVDTFYSNFKTGSNTIKVRPVVGGDESYYSSWSGSKQIYIYDAPSSIKYDGATITWVGSSSAYEININGNSETIKSARYDYNSAGKDFDVEIKCVGNHTSSFDSKCSKESFHYLDTVTNIVVEDGALHWDPVDEAVGYRIRVNGVVKDAVIGATSYDKVPAGQSIDYSILPYNDNGNYFSSWSATKTVYVLPAPVSTWNADLELDGEANNNYVWNAVNGADGYTVVLEKDGKIETTLCSYNTWYYSNTYEDIGIYKIKVKANAPVGDSNYYDSKYSKEMTIERLAAPTSSSTNFIISDPADISKGFTVNYVTVNGAKGYQMYKDGMLLEGKYSTSASITDTSIASSTITTEQHYTYLIRSIGDVRTVGGITTVRLSSLSRSSLSFDITVQAVPTNLKMIGYFATWDNVSGNNGYSVAFDGSSTTATEEYLNMETILPGNYNVKVCTKGNGSATLPSAYTKEEVVVRLSYPTDIKIISSEGCGVLSYNSVSNAKGYSVYLDNSTQALDETAYTQMDNYITEQGSVLSMVANANEYKNEVYYMTSPISPAVQFIKLSAPIFPEGAIESSKELIWNAPVNINTSEYTPSYEVFESDISRGIVNATKYNISELEAGNYTFTVKAVGNTTKYIDSNVSLRLAFEKLETPVLTIDEYGYHWNSVPNASAYVLEIDGVKVDDNIHSANQTYTYMPHYTSVGTHTVKLYAVGNGRTTVDSNAFEYKQRVEVLVAPEIEYAYSSDSYVKNGELSATIITETPHAKNYQYEIAGKTIITDELTASQVMESTGEFTIQVKALGGVFDEEETYYVDSQYSTTYTIYLLSKPNLANFSLNTDGTIKWSEVTQANGYDYYVSYNGGEYSDMAHTGYASLRSFQDYDNYTNISIKVRASSNGAPNKVNSEWVVWTWTNNK